MSRMSLAEKANQLTCYLAFGSLDTSKVKDGIGEVAFSAMGQPTSAKGIADAIRKAQETIIKQSPNGIPAIFHCEALAGPVVPNAVCYPISIGLGASFEPDDVRDMTVRIRKQMVELGIRQALSPVLDLARDFRWGRTNENYGNDPTLVSAMACAFVEGLQGDDLQKGVAATAKHLLGYSQPEGGLNMSKVVCDKQELREVFAKPFEAVIQKSGIKSVMNAYSAIDGEPLCASKRILTDMLRDDMGFDGLVVADYGSIRHVIDEFHLTDDKTEAAIMCLEAGLDVELPNEDGYGARLVEAVRAGRLDEALINRSVERMLKLKFELGLFENPYPTLQVENFDNADNHRRSLEVTRKTITLTKNDGILPIKDPNTRIAVIGPSGNSVRPYFGTYMYGGGLEMQYQIMNRQGTTMVGVTDTTAESFNFLTIRSDKAFFDIVNGMMAQAYPEAKPVFTALGEIFKNATYTRGCAFSDQDDYDFEAAIKAAKEADIVIMAVGGKNGWGKHCTDGEGVDATIVGLHGRQHELIEKVLAVNPRMVVVHLDNKPLIDEWVYEHVPAILEAWIPAVYGGHAIADVISGKYNPGARLSVDVPRSIGQMPIYHYQYNGSRKTTDSAHAHGGYVNEASTPRLPFGHGLSYTSFKYSDFKLSADNTAEVPVITVSVSIQNTGAVAGDEVAQLYGKDKLASMVRPNQELIGFKRVSLQPGETKTVV